MTTVVRQVVVIQVEVEVVIVVVRTSLARLAENLLSLKATIRGRERSSSTSSFRIAVAWRFRPDRDPKP